MPAPASPTFVSAVKDSMLTELLAAIDADAVAAYINILDESDTVLASITLDQPAGAVSSGVLTLAMAGPDSSADASGTASWAALYDGADNLVFSLPVQQSATAVANKLAMNTTTVVAGGPVEIVSFTVG